MKRKKIRSSWTEYFNFSARERRGAIFLSFIIFLQIGYLYYQRNRPRDQVIPDPQIKAALLELAERKIIDSTPNVSMSNSVTEIAEPFTFDPNLLDDQSWTKLGLNERQTKTIRNYLSKGGKFKIKSDFKKMYCISTIEYERLEPFLLLPDSVKRENKFQKKSIAKTIVIDVNLADSVAFESLNGIGPVLASRIVRYREKLGGFYSLEQLKEVWGINDTLFQALLPQLTNKMLSPFRYIHLNTDSFSILATHPYVRGKVAGLICNFRKQHGTFSTIDEVRQLPLITEENFIKLAPYLKTD